MVQYTKVTVQHIPQYRGYGSVHVQHNKKNMIKCKCIRLLFFYFQLTVAQPQFVSQS